MRIKITAATGHVYTARLSTTQMTVHSIAGDIEVDAHTYKLSVNAVLRFPLGVSYE